MKIDDFIQEHYELPQEIGYGAGEFPEFSIERVKQMLKDLLVLAANKAKIKHIKPNGTEQVCCQLKNSFSIIEVDKESILNILEDE